jgi:SSS family transporter
VSHLSAIDWIVCVAYLAVVVGLAVCSMRGQRDNEDYFVGGRRMSWLAVGVSMFATSFSSISFLGLPQRGAYENFSFYLVILGIPLIITPLLWFFFVPLYARMRVSSGYSYLRLRFGPVVQRVGSLLYCGYALGWMGAMLYAIALTLQGVMDLSPTQYLWTLIGLGAFATAYTAVGGLRAVVWTDVLQAVTLGGAVIAVLALAVSRIDGGLGGLWRMGQERLTMFHLESNPLATENFTDKSSVYSVLAFVVFMYLPGYAVAQNMIQRYVCAGSVRRGRGVVVLSAGVNAGLGFLFMLVGVALFVFYTQPGGGGMPKIDPQNDKVVRATNGSPDSAEQAQPDNHTSFRTINKKLLDSEDQILPHFLSTQAAGVGLVGLMLAGLFAAAMSTIDSGINGVASVVVYDWLEGKQLPLLASRALTVVLGALVIVAALVAPLIGKNVIDIINAIAGTLLGGLMAVFLLGMFSRRANAAGVLIGLSTGAACLVAVILWTGVPKWWYGAFTIFPTLVIGSLASYWFAPPRKEALSATIRTGWRPPSVNGIDHERIKHGEDSAS